MKRLFLTVIACSLPMFASAQNYYVNPTIGNDANDGKSITSPIKTVKGANKLKLKAGDSLLFAAGKVHWGELALVDLKGTEDKPITISSYQQDETVKATKATINARGFYNGIKLINSRYVTISDLIVTAPKGEIFPYQKKIRDKSAKDMRIGVMISAHNKGTYAGIKVDNLTIRDIYFNKPGVTRSQKETNSPNGTESYGFGIRVFAKGAASYDNMVISNNTIVNVSHTGIKLNGKKDTVKNVTLANNKVFDIGGPGMQLSGGKSVHVMGNIVKNSGSTKDSRNWGRGSGMWTWGSSHVLVEYNKFLNANGPADSAGFHIDFNCDNVIVQYNISANNAGGFIEILGNNYNNAYRYNVSINDGYRVKGKNNAFQEGKFFWLSGFNGKDKKHKGPYNSYIYNNTIYVDEDILGKVAVTRMTDGVLVANNIFHVLSKSKSVKGDQYRPESKGKSEIKDVLFTNNIFAHAKAWPKAVMIQDQSPILGDVKFAKAGGEKLTDYIPTNFDLVMDKGIEIPFIPNDDKGLFLGLAVKHDILGNPIIGKPDMGAIELSRPSASQ